MNLKEISFIQILTFMLVAGCVLNPFASALGFLFLLAQQSLLNYFTANISDKDRKDISTLLSDVSKLKEKAEKEGLAKAFRQ